MKIIIIIISILFGLAFATAVKLTSPHPVTRYHDCTLDLETEPTQKHQKTP